MTYVAAGALLVYGAYRLLIKPSTETPTEPTGVLRLSAVDDEINELIPAPFEVWDMTTNSATPAWATTTSTDYMLPTEKALPTSGQYLVIWGSFGDYVSPGAWDAGHLVEGTIKAYTQPYY